jgi:hypothetical protein
MKKKNGNKKESSKIVIILENHNRLECWGGFLESTNRDRDSTLLQEEEEQDCEEERIRFGERK